MSSHESSNINWQLSFEDFTIEHLNPHEEEDLIELILGSFCGRKSGNYLWTYAEDLLKQLVNLAVTHDLPTLKDRFESLQGALDQQRGKRTCLEFLSIQEPFWNPLKETSISNLQRANIQEIKVIYSKLVALEKVDPQIFMGITATDLEQVSKWLGEDSQRVNKRINFDQFNELLLILNQTRVSREFFTFFFQQNCDDPSTGISLEELKAGVGDFRGFAMLCYGSFRYAFKILSNKTNISQLIFERIPHLAPKKNKLTNRPPIELDISHITAERTWLVGETTTAPITDEMELFSAPSTRQLYPFTDNEYGQLGATLNQWNKDLRQIIRQAMTNTEIYLTWDYLDLYIATSMRKKWEYEETNRFIDSVIQDPALAPYKLRHFDPTQSKCGGRLDKGLLEGLCLKRVQICLYMVGESDTMGKDSELAATLAQNKIVLAYVPEITDKDFPNFVEKIKTRPIEYFPLRIQMLRAENYLNREGNPEDDMLLDQLLVFLRNYRKDRQPFTLWEEKDQQLVKDTFEGFDRVCELIAEGEKELYNKRADILKKFHPLSLQVDLKTGVGNGLLLIRSKETCVHLLQQIFDGTLNFTIVEKDYGKGITILQESLSECPYRVVTKDEKLTNSFWSFYLDS